ncbi:MAG: hydroxymethylbilane synthase [Desulfobacterium sp.]|nr:hydroxymethylbilane synthase [Desulfobacterium sp.]
MRKKIIIGSRASALAIWQANHIKAAIEKHHNKIEVEINFVSTKGDIIVDVALSKIGDKGLFTKELEIELINGTIDIAVHSLKDLETTLPPELQLVAVTKRHPVEDVLIARAPGTTINMLPKNGTVATGSLRRRSQLKHIRPDLNVVELRGNVPTRIQKFMDSDWDAIILARAGVERLELTDHISSFISMDEMLPAVGQGALGIQIKRDNTFAEQIVRFLHDEDTFYAVSAERSLLRALEGGCQVPIGAYAKIEDKTLYLEATVASIDGQRLYRKKTKGEKHDAENIGKMLANNLLEAGADTILAEIYRTVRSK